MNSEDLIKLSHLYPDFKDRVLAVVDWVKERTGREMFPTETLRSMTRQRALYGRGRVFDPRTHVWTVIDRSKIVTNAPPGMSMHHYGVACDFAFRGGDPYLAGLPSLQSKTLWAEYGRACHVQGLRWGGDWNGNGRQDAHDFDGPHCEKSYGVKIQTLLDSLQSPKGIKAVWRVLDRERGIV